MKKNDYIILGIHDAHDASAAIMVGGKIIAAVQEERFSRLKGESGYQLCREQAEAAQTAKRTIHVSSGRSHVMAAVYFGMHPASLLRSLLPAHAPRTLLLSLKS